jgi:hypothetical protein
MSQNRSIELHYLYFIFLSSSLLLFRINSLTPNIIDYLAIIFGCYLIYFMIKHQKVRINLFYMINSLILANYYVLPYLILYLLILILILNYSLDRLTYLFKYLAFLSITTNLFLTVIRADFSLGSYEFAIFSTFLIVYLHIVSYFSEKISKNLFVFLLIDKLIIFIYLCVGLIRFQDNFLTINLILLISIYFSKIKSS